MGEVVAHVVAAEGEHGHGVAADDAGFSGGGGGGFGGHDRAEEDAVLPGEGFLDEGDGGGAAATEEDGGDGDAGGVFPFGGDDGTLAGRDGKAGVGMGGFATGFGIPGAAGPIDEGIRGGAGHFLPPDVIIVGEGAVGEEGVASDGLHGVGVGGVRGTRGDAEEAGFGVDGVKLAIRPEFHPGDVVADGLDFPADEGGVEHGKVGFAAGGGEGTGDEFGLAGWGGEFEDEHVFCEPAFVAGLDGSNAEGVAFFSEECVAAVAGADGEDFAGFGEVADVFILGIVWPGDVGLVRCRRARSQAERMNAADEIGGVAEGIQHFGADAGHDVHGGGDVGGVGKLDTDVSDGRTDGAHGVGDDVEGSAAHGVGEEGGEFGFHFERVGPVVGGAGIRFVLGADEGELLDASDIAGIGAAVEGVGAFFGIEFDEGAGFDHLVAEAVVFFGGTGAEVDIFGGGEGGGLIDEGGEGGVRRHGREDTGYWGKEEEGRQNSECGIQNVGEGERTGECKGGSWRGWFEGGGVGEGWFGKR